ncbi:MAG: sugar phosphate isomerase/epimerase [Firmicutes bacterium]|nr:sugar phosphate isomerase/epimerase [Bacillota bacterium]
MAMNLGISSYCLCNKLYSKQWEIFDIMNWAKEHECTHMEVVPFGLPLFKADGVADMDFAKAIGEHAAKLDLPLSAFSLNACFIRPGDDEEQGSSNRERNVTVQYHGTREDKFEQELMRVTTVMNMAKEMGVKNFRSDVCSGAHPLRINTPEQFEEDFPVFVKAVKLLADHAASLGMTLTLENHGLYVNGADRVIHILRAADKPNVGLTVDVGNYLCVDEDPVVSVAKAIKYADMIHLKDFYIRKVEKMYPQNGMYVNFPEIPNVKPRKRPTTPEEWAAMIPSFGYVGTAAGNTILRGAIIGQGDMDMWKIISIIKNSGYKKQISLEFEGMEDCIAGTTYGLETARYIWERV